jgi:hypothetical protein
MSFLRRMFGERSPAPGSTAPDPEIVRAAANGITHAPEQDEAARDHELLRAEADRLADDLIQRQLRYADRSWTPPAQGGTRRADDPDEDREG